MIEPVTGPTAGRRTWLLPVLVQIEEHLDEPLSLAALAAVAGFSPHHFHRVFHHEVGETPAAYLRRLRLERAVYRLKISPDSVLEIALQAGFSTNETFTRAFARQFAMNPSRFRDVVRDYRAVAFEVEPDSPGDGFTDRTPLTLRFGMRKAALTLETTPGRHLIFVRHHGYEHLLRGKPLKSLWDEVEAFAQRHGIDYDPDLRVAITHDDPYVTEDSRIRFDACLVVANPTGVAYPVGSRYLRPSTSVARRHDGGLEEVARTFAYIGVEWLTVDHRLSAAPPFEVIDRTRGTTVAYVPLEPRTKEST